MNFTKDDEAKLVIIEAATRVFRKWGLNKTTMEDIAREAGKGKSTLYYYYKSKEEIFYSTVMFEFNKILKRSKEAIDDIPSAKGKIKKYIVTSLTSIRDLSGIYPILIGEIRGNSTILNKLKEDLHKLEFTFIKDILTSGNESKEFMFENDIELDLAANVIVGLIHSMEFYLFLDTNDTEQVNMAAKLITNGI